MSEYEFDPNSELLAEEFGKIGLETDPQTIEQLINLGFTKRGFDIIREIVSEHHVSSPSRFALELSRNKKIINLDKSPNSEEHVDKYGLVATDRPNWYFSLLDVLPENSDYDDRTIIHFPKIGDIQMTNDPYIKLIRATQKMSQEQNAFGRAHLYNYQGPTDYFPDHRYIVISDPQSEIDQLDQNIVIFDPELMILKLFNETDYVIDNDTYHIFVDHYYPLLMHSHYPLSFPNSFFPNSVDPNEVDSSIQMLGLGLSENQMKIGEKMERVSLFTRYNFKRTESRDKDGKTEVKRSFFPDIYALSKDKKHIFQISPSGKYPLVHGEVQYNAWSSFSAEEEGMRSEISKISNNLVKAGLSMSLQSPDEKNFIRSRAVIRNGEQFILPPDEEPKSGEDFVWVYRMRHEKQLEQMDKEYGSDGQIPYGPNYDPLQN